jgi:uncharacterized protein
MRRLRSSLIRKDGTETKIRLGCRSVRHHPPRTRRCHRVGQRGDFISITRTAGELSIVCPTKNLPADIHSSHRWVCLKLDGPFSFSQTGALLSFIQPLSDNGIPIFASSTYDTDYVLIQEEFAGAALDLLRTAGHEFIS